jgi:hypothetical protein
MNIKYSLNYRIVYIFKRIMPQRHRCLILDLEYYEVDRNVSNGVGRKTIFE